MQARHYIYACGIILSQVFVACQGGNPPETPINETWLFILVNWFRLYFSTSGFFLNYTSRSKTAGRQFDGEIVSVIINPFGLYKEKNVSLFFTGVTFFG